MSMQKTTALATIEGKSKDEQSERLIVNFLVGWLMRPLTASRKAYDYLLSRFSKVTQEEKSKAVQKARQEERRHEAIDVRRLRREAHEEEMRHLRRRIQDEERQNVTEEAAIKILEALEMEALEELSTDGDRMEQWRLKALDWAEATLRRRLEDEKLKNLEQSELGRLTKENEQLQRLNAELDVQNKTFASMESMITAGVQSDTDPYLREAHQKMAWKQVEGACQRFEDSLVDERYFDLDVNLHGWLEQLLEAAFGHESDQDLVAIRKKTGVQMTMDIIERQDSQTEEAIEDVLSNGVEKPRLVLFRLYVEVRSRLWAYCVPFMNDFHKYTESPLDSNPLWLEKAQSDFGAEGLSQLQTLQRAFLYWFEESVSPRTQAPPDWAIPSHNPLLSD